MSNTFRREFSITLIRAWLSKVAAGLLALLCAVLILATSTPLPLTGWGRDTFWGELLAGWPGNLAITMLASTGLAMAALLRNWPAAVLALPLVTLLIAAPARVSQDEGLLNSFILLEESSARVRAQVSPETTATLIDVLRTGGTTDLILPLSGPLGRPGSWSGPETYAFDAWMEKWRTDGEPKAREIIAVTLPTFEDLSDLQAEKNGFEYSVVMQEQCLDELRRLDPDGAQWGEADTTGQSCGPFLDYSDEIAALQTRIDTAEGLKTQADLIQANAVAAARDILETTLVVQEAQDRFETWRRSLAVSLAITAAVLMAAASFDNGHRLPLATAALVALGHFGQRLTQTDHGLEAASGHFVTLHGIFLLALYLAVRIIRAFVVQNADIWRMQQPFHLGLVFVRSLGWWSGLALATCGGVYLGVQATHLLETATYGIPLRDKDGNPTTLQLDGQWLCEDQTQTMIVPASSTDKQLEADIDNTVRCYLAKRQAEILQADVVGQMSSALENVEDVAGNAFDHVVPWSLPCNANGASREGCISPAFDYPDCSWYELRCKLRRMPHVAADRAYSDARARMRVRFIDRVVASANATVEAATSTQDAAQPALAEAVRSMSLAVRDAVSATFRTWDVINAISALVFAIAIIKSFGFVLARVLFDDLARRGLRIAPPRGNTVPSRIAFSDENSRRVETPGRYYVNCQAEVTSVAPTGPWLWKPWKFALARFPGLTFLNRFTCISADDGIHFTGINAQDFVRIDLGENAEVAFTVGRLHAFSSSLAFRRVWSFRLTNLVLGRASMAVARGPGVLFLCSLGAVKGMSAAPAASFAPDRLLVWQPNCSFDVKSTLSIESIYMGGITIRGAQDVTALYDAKGYRAGLGGALKFVPMLLLPF